MATDGVAYPARPATSGNSCRAAATFFADPGAGRHRLARAAIAAELGAGRAQSRPIGV